MRFIRYNQDLFKSHRAKPVFQIRARVMLEVLGIASGESVSGASGYDARDLW